MEWIKKNWMSVAIVAIVIAVIIYFVNKKRKEQGKTPLKLISAIPGLGSKSTAPATTPEQEKTSLDALKKQLADCEEQMKSARLATGGVHPCANLRDQVAKAEGVKTESNFAGPLTKTEGLNVMDYAMGSQGLSLFEDKNMKQGESNYVARRQKMCKYPDGTPVPCDLMEEAKRTGSLMM